MLPKVLILGRVNVGKSALFNRLSKSNKAIVYKEPGATLDLLEANITWNGVSFILLDSGGLTLEGKDELNNRAQDLLRKNIAEANLLLWVLSAKEVITTMDQEISLFLRKIGKPVILVANKVDNPLEIENLAQFYELNWGEPIPVSALTGFNAAELLDVITERLPKSESPSYSVEGKIAIVGRTNVGKSSLLNALLGEERVLISDQPGTTRDAIDSLWRTKDGDFMLIDTAGIKRQAKIKGKLEYLSIQRAKAALRRSDMAMLVLSAPDGIREEDKKIAGLIQEAGRACLIVVNKCDLVDFQKEKAKKFQSYLSSELDFLSWAEVVFVSVKTGMNIERIPNLAFQIFQNFRKKFSTSFLNKVLAETVSEHPPPLSKGRQIKIHYITQTKTAPPFFTIFASHPELHFSYLRHLKKEFYSRLKLTGTPIFFEVKGRSKNLVRRRS